MSWVQVEEDIINYLAEDSQTKIGIRIMEEEFIDVGMADIMLSNISYSRAEEVAKSIEDIKGVSMVVFENTEDHYKEAAALIVVQFQYEETDPKCLEAMDKVRELVEPYDSSISTIIGFDMSEQLTKDMTLVAVLAIIIILIVLALTSNSYGEIPVLLMTFGAAALLNLGSNFMLGKISFITNSVGVILQLALAIDYAVILGHRFFEERSYYGPEEAAKEALYKAIKEISASSLTTIAGLTALSFMEFKIGMDLAQVLIKAIVLSMVSVFTLMPGLLVLFSDIIDKTRHRSFISSVSALGRFSLRTRKIMPPIFIIILIISFFLSSKCPYLFSMEDIRAHRLSEVTIAKDRIADKFGQQNMIALMVPAGDYEAEKNLLTSLSSYDQVSQAVGLSNTEAMGGYTLTDRLTPRQLAELMDMDLEVMQVLYSAYAINQEEYSKIVNGINRYGVPLIDMVQFLYQEVVEGFIGVEDEQMAELAEMNDLLTDARKQMEGPNYARMPVYLDLQVEGEETEEFINLIYQEMEYYYPDQDSYILGESTNALDLAATFDVDNLLISILSALFVVIILAFTFKSAGLPILLISVIQASIWINFSFPYIRGDGLYFLGFLIVSSIQMGANIDYAIVISSRYLDLRKRLSKEEAVIEALNQGFPTVITSGSILAVAGILIGYISTDGATAILGSYLGQGTIISIILVIFVLPQLLYLGDGLIEKTSFAKKKKEEEKGGQADELKEI